MESLFCGSPETHISYIQFAVDISTDGQANINPFLSEIKWERRRYSKRNALGNVNYEIT
jgi:hypothetical protein